MPYSRNNDLPANIRRDLPREAQSVWRRAFNDAHSRYNDDSFAARVAWTAVRNAGWRKEGDSWVRKNYEGTVAKVDEQNNLVFGYAYVSVDKDGSQIVDHSGELIDPNDLEMAAYAFNLQFRESGVMHEGDAVGHLVESLAITEQKLEAMGLEKNALPQGWWLGFYIPNNDVFQKVKEGTYSMFSIQGKAIAEEV